MKYTEESEFVLRLALRCEFPEDYEGDEDGYAWREGFAPIAAQMVRAAAAVLRDHPGWRLRPINRGRPADEEVALLVERVLPPSPNEPQK